jgi:hypothetical protein
MALVRCGVMDTDAILDDWDGGVVSNCGVRGLERGWTWVQLEELTRCIYCNWARRGPSGGK